MTTLTANQVAASAPESTRQTAPSQATVSPEDLANLPDDGHLNELVDGQLVEKIMSNRSVLAANTLHDELMAWARSLQAGRSFVEPRLRCFPFAPNQIRVPDVAFFTAAQLADLEWNQAFFGIAPDLVVEVISPHDKISDLDRKIDEYQRAGVKHVWTLNPDLKIARIHRGPGDLSEMVGEANLTDEPLLPGFQCPLPALFALPGQ